MFNFFSMSTAKSFDILLSKMLIRSVNEMHILFILFVRFPTISFNSLSPDLFLMSPCNCSWSWSSDFSFLTFSLQTSTSNGLFLPVHLLNLQLLTGSLCMSFFSYNISYHRLHSRLYIRSCRLRAHWIKLENVTSFHCGITAIDNTLLNSQMQLRVVMSENSNVFARIIMNIQAIYSRAKFVT